jgi:hypothetical protein
MLEETAMVVSISQGHAMVALVRSEACGDCAAKSMCNPVSDNTMQMEVENPVGAKPGERVIIELPPEASGSLAQGEHPGVSVSSDGHGHRSDSGMVTYRHGYGGIDWSSCRLHGVIPVSFHIQSKEEFHTGTCHFQGVEFRRYSSR